MPNGQTPPPSPPPGVPVPPAVGPTVQRATPPPASSPPAPYWAYPPRRPSAFKRILLGFGALVLFVSILMNFYLIAVLAASLDGKFSTTTIREGQEDQTVAVYAVEGIIDRAAAQHFARFYAEIKGDDVKAVVLRVDSPGGGVTSSDQIHHLVGKLRKDGKKVVVSMGGVAASGGYYISAGADEIIAEPTTITGSIGAIMGWLVIRGTLEKIGMETVMIKSSNARGWKDEISSFKLPDPRQREHLQEILDKIQEKFEDVVRTGRGSRLKPREKTYALEVGEGDEARQETVTETEPLNGKIYLAEESKELGLIDGIGYLTDATDRAAALAGLTDAKVVRYEIRRGLLAELVGAKSSPGLELNVKSLDEFQTPRIMLMWKAE